MKYIFLATKKGLVKKSSLEKFANIRSSGLIAINLSRHDELCWANLTNGNNEVMLITYLGKAIKFREADVRPMARDTIGVRGIKLNKDDFVVAMEIIKELKKKKGSRLKPYNDLLVVMERGLGKRTNVNQFPLQRRGGRGVKVANITEKTGKVISAQLVNQNIEQVVLTSKHAQIIKLPLRNIPRLNRTTQGVILMRFSRKDDRAVAATLLEKES